MSANTMSKVRLSHHFGPDRSDGEPVLTGMAPMWSGTPPWVEKSCSRGTANRSQRMAVGLRTRRISFASELAGASAMMITSLAVATIISSRSSVRPTHGAMSVLASCASSSSTKPAKRRPYCG